jgi:hypothetical protein
LDRVGPAGGIADKEDASAADARCILQIEDAAPGEGDARVDEEIREAAGRRESDGSSVRDRPAEGRVGSVVRDERPAVREVIERRRSDIAMVPLPAVESVPPVTNAPAVNCTCDPSSAMIVPPPLSNIPLPLPVRRRMPPSRARMSPKLRRSPASLGSITSANPETFASINPPLRTTIPSSFVPRLPLLFVSPWIV